MSETEDSQHWAAVEEATELLVERRFDAALLDLRRVLRSDPRNPYAHQVLGEVLSETGHLEAARDAFRAAVALAPAFVGARVALSNVLRLTGDTRGAIREAQLVLQTNPKDADALRALGLAQAKQGERPNAKKNLQRYLDTTPEQQAEEEVRALLEMLGVGEGPLDPDE